LENLASIPAYAYPTTGNELKLPIPGRSVQFVLLEPGNQAVSVQDDEPGGIPPQFELHQNFPNPFNPRTAISYSLPHESHVTLKVFDVLGREIITLLRQERRPAGRHEISLEMDDLPSGAYLYRLQTESSAATKMMLLVK
jgi:hypothetical protein